MGRCSNAIGLRLGKTVGWNNNTVELQEKQRHYELFFYKQIVSFFQRRSIINSEFIFCGLKLIWEKGCFVANVQLYDSKDVMGIKVTHNNFMSNNTHSTFDHRVVKVFSNNVHVYNNNKLNNLFFKIQKHNYIRLALLEKGILVVAKRCFTERVYVRFKILKNENVTSLLITTYLCVKLKQQYFLSGLTKPIINLLNSISGIEGYKIRYAGRFNRNPRGRKQIFRGGSLSLSKISTHIDYNEKNVILKFGKCGLKVWLNTNKEFKKYQVAVDLSMCNGKNVITKRA